ncbi:PQQ-binding-like beta-propeller repeat protein [Cellulomonas sp. S1-8]|uniref:outer membrane protein assembly factor BamB family protein n=1 Tax=Cellulomonas sp. S1-8 TaxID=2904790 RepID=UPI002243A829|nr:PQQ-binding-like beta-propeller repeat protein [Cellulomonas sp. S1-8]UZN03434.1 PQQ-binding-like beta-propeller repeat protein [Cellulomonas sp. S1-8]
MAGRGARHDVELVEDDEPTSDAAAPGPTADDPARVRRRRRRLSLGAAVLAVAVAGAVVAQGVVDRRERARVAAIAAQPGAVEPLAGPATVLWDAPAEHLEQVQVRTPGGLLVGLAHTAEGPVRAVALDARTGETAWQVELVDGADRRAPDLRGSVYAQSGSCTGGLSDEHLVVCLAHDGSAYVANDTWAEVAPTTTRLVVLDSRDGSVVADLSDTLVEGSTPTLTTFDDLVVLHADGAQDEEPSVRAIRVDGTAVWEVPVPASTGDAQTFATSVGDVLAVTTPTDLLLLDARGATVRSVPLDGHVLMGVGHGALYLSARPARDDDGTLLGPPPRTTVVRADGDVEVDGDVFGVGVDDGSVPGLVLTTGVDGQMQAWDRDGRALWSYDETSAWGAIVLDGRVHLTSGTELVALDARTGAELWRSDATSRSPVTDGRYLLALAAVPARGARSQLVALDPSDGSEVWRSPLPDGTDEVESQLHLLIAYGYDAGSDALHLAVLG